MCGIVGAVAERNITAILLEGLKRLEYRGYDSAGVAVLDEKGTKMSKSLGNVVDPRVIIGGGNNLKQEPAYGADVLRLWVSSVDYSSDVLIGKNIIKQVSESYRKVRGTLRFLLGNLSDFDPAAHAADAASLPSLDRYMLTRLGAVLGELEGGYDTFQLYRFSQALQNFVVNDLSTFYLDIAKDRLYIAGAESASRRSCQNVLYRMLVSMLPAIAPVMPHLAEDAFLHLPFEVPVGGAGGERAVSVFEMGPAREGLGAACSAEELALWSTLRALRNEVNKVLEAARAEKTIGSGLDAEVSVFVADGAVREQLGRMTGPGADEVNRLEKLLIVSGVAVHEDAESVRAMAAPGVSVAEVEPEQMEGGVCIAVRRARGRKCERCWHYCESVGTLSAHPTLCGRCAPVVEGQPRLLSAV